MNPERWQRIDALLSAALDCKEEQRASFLSQACEGDEDLKNQVQRMLSAHSAADGFLEGSPPAAATLIAAQVEADANATAPHRSQAPTPFEGARIGAYQLVRELGRGGMGTVYLAERVDEAYHKQVAIKVVQRGMDTDFIISRFRNERQILAALAHPNIAALLDGGTTKEGLPYFVMEYVDGESIDSYCDANRLTISRRLELFSEVCGAVQYSHRNLIVHRDIKPSNILVPKEGVPKLLDFGVAKILQPQTASLEQTMTQVRLLTPAFASPEQIRGDPITTASDVYSLGVVLYILLTGHKPYRTPTGSYDVMARVICEEEPLKPSAAISLQDKGRDGHPSPTLQEVSEARGETPDKLRRRLSGDLDTIVLKALRKEPERRYTSVEQLAEDLRRHREGLPISARRSSTWYRAVKFVTRHRVGVGAVALIVLLLAGGLFETSRQRMRAERHSNDVRKLADSFLFEFQETIKNLPGTTKARELAVKRAAEYLDRLAREAQQEVDLQRDLAAAFERLGEIQGGGAGANLGDSQGALESYSKALSIRRALAARAPHDGREVAALADLELLLGSFFVSTGELGRAEDHVRSAVGHIEGLIASDPNGPDRRGRLAAAYHRLGFVQARRGDEPAAFGSLQTAIWHSESFCGAHPQDASARASLAFIRNDLAQRFERAGQVETALENTRKARAIQEALIEGDPANTRFQRDLIVTLTSEGRYLLALGKNRESVESHTRGLALAESQLATDPQNRWAQIAVMMSAHALGGAMVKWGQTSAAVERLMQGARIGASVVAADPAGAFARNELADVYTDLGGILVESKIVDRSRDGCQFLKRAVEMWKALQHDDRMFGEYQPDQERAMAGLAQCPPHGP
jgi:eukaryotic-like serine/threonine-protein kinase